MKVFGFTLLFCLSLSLAFAGIGAGPEVYAEANPARGVFHVPCNINDPVNEITVLDAAGKEVKKVKVALVPGKLQIDLGGNTPGTYFVRINNGKKTVTETVEFTTLQGRL